MAEAIQIEGGEDNSGGTSEALVLSLTDARLADLLQLNLNISDIESRHKEIKLNLDRVCEDIEPPQVAVFNKSEFAGGVYRRAILLKISV